MADMQLVVGNKKNIASVGIDLEAFFAQDTPVDESKVIDYIHACLHGKKGDKLIVEQDADMPYEDGYMSLSGRLDSGEEVSLTRSWSHEGKKKNTHLLVLKDGKPVEKKKVQSILDELERDVADKIEEYAAEMDIETADVATEQKEEKEKKKKKEAKRSDKKMKKIEEKVKLTDEGATYKAYTKTKNPKKAKKGKVWIKVKDSVIDYEKDLRRLQIELLKYQNHIISSKGRMIILFEGRDSSGKGGAIKRFTAHLNPRYTKVVALEKPTEIEKTQWYFQRYVNHFPSAGQILCFDRSWYNRAMVEPVMGFCTEDQHRRFLQDVVQLEHMLVKDHIRLHKFYFSITKDEQKKRFDSRITDPLKQFKISPVDREAQLLWDKYTLAKFEMFLSTHRTIAPWTVVKTNDKKTARLNMMKHVLHTANYEGKTDDVEFLTPDPSVIIPGNREIANIQEQLKNNIQNSDG